MIIRLVIKSMILVLFYRMMILSNLTAHFCIQLLFLHSYIFCIIFRSLFYIPGRMNGHRGCKWLVFKLFLSSINILLRILNIRGSLRFSLLTLLFSWILSPVFSLFISHLSALEFSCWGILFFPHFDNFFLLNFFVPIREFLSWLKMSFKLQ